jgi:hypothetical protein
MDFVRYAHSTRFARIISRKDAKGKGAKKIHVARQRKGENSR